jgi:hypothetical protein
LFALFSEVFVVFFSSVVQPPLAAQGSVLLLIVYPKTKRSAGTRLDSALQRIKIGGRDFSAAKGL